MTNCKALFAVALIAFCASVARADDLKPAPGLSTYYTATWQFEGTCEGKDSVYDWRIAGGMPGMKGDPHSWKITPWESEPITVRSIELTKVYHGGTPAPERWWRRIWARLTAAPKSPGPGTTLWFMAGNDYIHDAMLWLGPGEDHGYREFPGGTGMQLPAKQDAADSVYFDLHGGCAGGGPVSIFYTVGYTVP